MSGLLKILLLMLIKTVIMYKILFLKNKSHEQKKC